MCTKCGTVYDLHGKIDKAETEEKILEFVVYYSDIRMFDKWNCVYNNFKRKHIEYIALNEFRSAVDKFLKKNDIYNIIRIRDKIISSEAVYNIAEKILIALEFE